MSCICAMTMATYVLWCTHRPGTDRVPWELYMLPGLADGPWDKWLWRNKCCIIYTGLGAYGRHRLVCTTTPTLGCRVPKLLPLQVANELTQRYNLTFPWEVTSPC